MLENMIIWKNTLYFIPPKSYLIYHISICINLKKNLP